MKLQYTFLLAILCLFSLETLAKDTPLIYNKGKAEITLKDNLEHPFYWWPSTLLSYPITFEEQVNLNQLILVNKANNEQLPFQLSEIANNEDGNQTAVLHLISDLPSAGSYTFLLKPGTPKDFEHLAIDEQANEFILNTDILSLKVPKQVPSVADLPGPVMALRQKDEEWMGHSVFHAGDKSLKSLHTEVVSQGPLFVEMQVKYTFQDDATYTASVRCIKGYDFVELKEWIDGFDQDSTAYWRMYWDGFSPTHRQAPNHPWTGPKGTNDEPGIGRYDWEKVGETMLSNHHGVLNAENSKGEIPFEIGVYDPWPAERTVSSSLFWDENSYQSVGAFMDNVAFWNDKEYSIWHSSRKLAIKFFYKDELLSFKYPVSSGKRSSAISCYSHQKDIDYMDVMENAHQKIQHPKGFKYGIRISQLSYNSFLQNRYSTIDLNVVKDWDLGYADSLSLPPVIFEEANIHSIDELEQRFLFGSYVNELAFSGPCQNSGYSPVPARSFYETYAVSYNRFLPEMNAEERNRFAAMFQFQAYMAAGEEYMPMKVMLSGHPNFLADVKGIPALAAFLFPDHSEADNWANLYEKYIELNTRYHTRPQVGAWNATGGRWTENLGAYVWAFFRPSIRANYVLKNYYDGKNRIATDRVAKVANYVLGTLSAPYDGESLEFYREDGKLDKHSWGIVTPETGPARVHPPQGAHAMRRRPPSVFWRIGKDLENFDPILSENIRYISRPEHEDMEALDREKSPFKIMYPDAGADLGTPPDFKSEKYTGYGIILRASVGTPDELSIHLTQIDEGHNYRWGKIADGGCGSIYFYAAGKSYSHNGKEDSGDRRLQDTDLITNFGAYKDGVFKSIGQNVLSSPLYDLGVGQFAEITSSKEHAYSWPEFQSRSIMLIGSDYFITYDDVYNVRIGTRFSWFTQPTEDLPEIQVIKGNGTGHGGEGISEKVIHTGRESKGISFDSTDDFMALVSHKKGFQTEQTAFGGIVSTPEGNKDYIFRNDEPVTVDEATVKFIGTAGFLRQKSNGSQEWGMFHGTKIGNAHFEINTENTNAGLSAIYEDAGEIQGEFYSPSNAVLTFSWVENIPEGVQLFVDGIDQTNMDGNTITFEFPKGQHIWQLTRGLPIPSRPEINFTSNDKNQVLVEVKPVDGASKYVYEYSNDIGKTWKKLATKKSNTITIKPETTEKKGHVRVIALNNDKQSKPSIIYPIYFTTEKPPFPDGLKVELCEQEISLSWGSVLGCHEYRIYKRKVGEQTFKSVFRGNANTFTDRKDNEKDIYEYSVSAINGNGESEKSNVVNTHPDNWLHFDPMPEEPFRRTRNTLGVSETEMYYPE